MKKLVVLIGMLAISGSVLAQHHHHGYNRHYGGGGYNWVAPAVIGGVIGYGLARPPVYSPPVVYQQPQIIYQQPPIIYEQALPNVIQPSTQCSMWIETQNPDGTITRSRTCSR